MKAIASLLVAIALILGHLFTTVIPAHAALPKQSAIKDAKVLLRNALPIDNPTIRDIQHTLEAMPKQANLKRWGTLQKEVEQILAAVNQSPNPLISAIPEPRRNQAQQDLQALQHSLQELQQAIANKDRNSIKPLSEQAVAIVGELESAMVAQFPFAIPEEYRNLPQLKGRAIAEVVTEKGSFRITLDGYSAPLNAGQFADLVQQGFYDGMTFSRADESYYLQTGDPEGSADGYIDPTTGKLRTVPMEIRVPQQIQPIYGHSLDEVGLTYTLPVLPFSAYGTVAMAHPANDNNGGSSQFFIYLFESELTPAGLNLMDGNYSVFGYVTEGQDVLYKLRLGDRIESIKLVSGAENLVNATPKATAPDPNDALILLPASAIIDTSHFS
jgi:peptidylprolyl isomerase